MRHTTPAPTREAATLAASGRFDHAQGSVLAAMVLHTSINFWPSVVPIVPTSLDGRPYALVVALLTAGAMVFLVSHRPAPCGLGRPVAADDEVPDPSGVVRVGSR